LHVEVAQSGSISRAAEAVDLSISAASRYLILPEARLGVPLVRRTTRNHYLTQAGAEFHRRAHRAIPAQRIRTALDRLNRMHAVR
jgi:DNA-binding transcriptional LysR family regulator